MRNSKSTLPTGFSIHRVESDATGDDYVLVRFPRTADRGRGEVIQNLAIATPRKLLSAMLSKGADVKGLTDPVTKLEQLFAELPETAGTMTESIGWKGETPRRSFLLPGRGPVGTNDAPIVLSESAQRRCLASTVAGSLNSWKENVAPQALRSPFAAATILTALAGPLLPFSSAREGFILNLAGTSSSGKSTANDAGASVWGDPKRIATWNATDRAIVEVAAANSCTCLVLDDAEKAAKNKEESLRRVHELTHTLTAERAREYADMVSDQLPLLTFSCIALSSSPRTIESQFRSRTDSDRVRFLELAINDGTPGNPYGIWLLPNGEPDPLGGNLSEELTGTALRNFGHAGRAWIAYLEKHQRKMAAKVAKLVKKFIGTLGDGLSGPRRRVATKIGLLFAAGVIAHKAGVLPWKGSKILQVAQFTYGGVIAAGFGAQSDPKKLTLRLKAAMADASAFPILTAKSSKKLTPLVEGQRGAIWKNGNRAYADLAAMKELAEQLQPTRQLALRAHDDLLEYLRASGALLAGHGGGPTQDVRMGPAKLKLLAFDYAKLCALWLQVSRPEPNAPSRPTERRSTPKTPSARRPLGGRKAHKQERGARLAK